MTRCAAVTFVGMGSDFGDESPARGSGARKSGAFATNSQSPVGGGGGGGAGSGGSRELFEEQSEHWGAVVGADHAVVHRLSFEQLIWGKGAAVVVRSVT
jgi:hypothetical protein